jgi:hypothetical protein
MRTSGVVSRRIAGEVVLIPTQLPRQTDANFYVLNESGQLLWQELEVPRSVDELAQRLVDSYSIARADAIGDVDLFVRDLQSCGAIVVEPSSEEL